MGKRPVVAGLCGLGALLLVVLAVGLWSTPVGAGDNGDGYRLFCGAGLVPATPDGGANWRGGVVLDFRTGGPVCADPVPSSALTVLRALTAGAGPTWSLAALGVGYAVLVGLVTALAAGAAGRRAIVLVPALVPLALPVFPRFFVSTYGEPAGLLGTCAVVLGAGVLAVSGADRRRDRVTGLALVAGGGLLAATAKTAYLPVLVMALAVCATTAVRLPGARSGVVGPVVAVAAAVLAVAPLTAALAWQQRTYAVVNAHNLVFTLVLPEVGADALVPLGLPPDALASAGRAYYPEGANGYAGSEVVAADPAGVRAAAHGVLLAHPGAVAAALGTGLTATLGAGLPYLPAAPLGPGSVAPVLGTTVGEQGADRAQLLGWLGALPVPWLPGAVVVAGAAAGVLGRRSGPLVAALGRVAALAAVTALGLVAAAVLGDGYFEIAKHVWLAAYLLGVTATALVLLPVVLLVQRRRVVTPRAGTAATLR